jgi:hypothetical protein
VKKFIAVFLLLIFLGKTAGIFGLFNFLRQENYESVFSNKVNELKLVKLVISKTKKVDWERKDEIIYEGKYYDVFSKTEDAKNIYLLCYSDSKDNQLKEMLDKHLSDDNLKKKPGSTTQETSMHNYIVQNCDWNVHLSSPEKISTQIFSSVCCGFNSVFSPPPDFLVC